MRHILSRAAFAAAFLLASLATALPHGDDEAMNMDMDMEMSMASTAPMATATAAKTHSDAAMSYFAYSKHSGTIIAHIALMVLGWCLVLPAGKLNWPVLLSAKTDLAKELEADL